MMPRDCLHVGWCVSVRWWVWAEWVCAGKWLWAGECGLVSVGWWVWAGWVWAGWVWAGEGGTGNPLVFHLMRQTQEFQRICLPETPPPMNSHGSCSSFRLPGIYKQIQGHLHINAKYGIHCADGVVQNTAPVLRLETALHLSLTPSWVICHFRKPQHGTAMLHLGDESVTLPSICPVRSYHVCVNSVRRGKHLTTATFIIISFCIFTLGHIFIF